MSDDKPKRLRPYSYRPPATRREELVALIKLSGLSANAFITEAIFGRTRHRPAELRSLAQIMNYCAKVADSLRNCDTSKTNDPILSECHAELQIIRAALMHLMGRKS